MIEALPDFLHMDDPTSNLSALPDFLHMEDPTSNLSGFAESNQVVLFDDGAELEATEERGNRSGLRWGAEIAVALALGSYGYMRSGTKGAIGWGLAGAFIPLPATLAAMLFAQRP